MARIKRIEPQHKLREYLESNKDSKYDLSSSLNIGVPDITKLKDFKTILSAERLYKFATLYNDNIANVIDVVYPDLHLPIKPKKEFIDNRTDFEKVLFPLHKEHISLEEIAYLTDIDPARLKEIPVKDTLVISASELILLEKVKKLKPGSLFKLKFGNMKIMRILKKK